MIDYQLEIIKKTRKTVSLKIKNSQTVTLLVPKRFDLDLVDSILEKHQNWIQKNLAKNLEKDQELKSISSQDQLLSEVLGELDFDSNPKKTKKKWETDFYPILDKEVDRYLAKTGLDKTNIDLKIGVFKTKWGSCQRKKALTNFSIFKTSNTKFVLKFNLALVFVPKRLIEYVVAHELTHILEMNHSSNFWQKLERIYPNSKTASKELKSYGNWLIFTNQQFK